MPRHAVPSTEGRRPRRARHRSTSASAPAAAVRPRWRTLVPVGVVALLVAGAVPAASAEGQPGGPGPVVVAADAFARTQTDSLGQASVGGAWRTLLPAGAAVGVVPGAANLSGVAPGSSVEAFLPSVAAGDVVAETVFAAPAVASANTYLATSVRRQPDGRSYRAKVVVPAVGAASLVIVRTGPGGVETALATRHLPWSGGGGAAVAVQLQAVGSDAIRLSARAWREGSTAPAWQVSAADSSGDRIGAGATGVWCYTSRSATTGGCSVRAVVARTVARVPGTAPSNAVTPSAPVTPSNTVTPSPPAPPAAGTSSSSSSGADSSTTSAPAGQAPSATTSPSPTRSATSAAPPSEQSGSAAAASPGPGSQAGGRGAVPLGTASYPVSSGAVWVSPSGDDAAAGSSSAPLATIAAALRRVPTGGQVVLRAGSYHETVTVTKPGVTIQNAPGEAVWLDGSVPVTGWSHSGATWVHTGWTAQFDRSTGFASGLAVLPAHPLAAWPDQAFLDGAELRQVASASQVVPGTFAVDYASQTLVVGDDPGSHEVRASDLALGMTITAADVTVQGIGVRRYATPLPQMGTLRVYGTSDTVRDLVVTQNATQGVTFLGSGHTAQRLTVTDNGMTGLHANQADGLSVLDSVVSDNNAEDFNPSPATAGMKLTRLVGLTVRNNLVEDNGSNGIWLDESVRQFSVVGNASNGNLVGIIVELSASGVVAGNTVDGRGVSQWGIRILGSGNIEVANNALGGATSNGGRQIGLEQDARRQANPADAGRDPRMPVPDPSCPWIVQDVVVANNTFDSSGSYQLFVRDDTGVLPASQMRVTVTGNVFAPRSGAAVIGWGGASRAVAAFQDAAAFNASTARGWTNTQTSTGSPAAPVLAGQLPATSDVARAVSPALAAPTGWTTGARFLGPAS